MKIDACMCWRHFGFLGASSMRYYIVFCIPDVSRLAIFLKRFQRKFNQLRFCFIFKAPFNRRKLNAILKWRFWRKGYTNFSWHSNLQQKRRSRLYCVFCLDENCFDFRQTRNRIVPDALPGQPSNQPRRDNLQFRSKRRVRSSAALWRFRDELAESFAWCRRHNLLKAVMLPPELPNKRKRFRKFIRALMLCDNER